MPHTTVESLDYIYRVASLTATRRQFLDAQWTDLDEPFEIPQGPCFVFPDPAGQQLAIYEQTRPFVERSFEGRFD